MLERFALAARLTNHLAQRIRFRRREHALEIQIQFHSRHFEQMREQQFGLQARRFNAFFGQKIRALLNRFENRHMASLNQNDVLEQVGASAPKLNHEHANEPAVCRGIVWLLWRSQLRGQQQNHEGASHEHSNHQHRLFRRAAHSSKIHLSGRRFLPAARVDKYSSKHQKLRAHRRRSRCASRYMGALGALRFAGDRNRTRREHSQVATTARWCKTGQQWLA